MTTVTPDFSAAQAVLQRHIDSQFLSGASVATLRDGVLVDSFCAGLADMQSGERLRPDHIHRAFSNTKLMTSVLALLLHDQGRFGLDDPIKQWIPAFAGTRVLKQGATSLDETEALQVDITVRHLLSHQAGLSHGVFDPGTPIFKAYQAIGARRPDTTLGEISDKLATLPLLFQPGTGWEYSMATDVLARVIEVVTGQTFGEALQTRLFEPLGMVDTGFVLRTDQLPRLAALYVGDPLDPTKPGLQRLENVPFPGAYVTRVPRQSGAGGLFTTQADMLRLVRQLLPGRPGLLKPATLSEMFRDQLLATCSVQFASIGAFPHLGFGLGGAVTRATSKDQPNSPVGEFQWGGLAGTHWWIAPDRGVAGVLMTQRFMGFWNPFWFEYKARVYDALAQGTD
jgi:CubicO group peptidase (beta-lactamase class C family)